MREARTAGRRRGAAKLRPALENARDGASSRPESGARLILLDGGLPEPELDVDVFDDRGRFLGCSELAYPERRLAIEYESRGHLTPYQLRRDAEKCNDYQSAGWRIVRLTRSEVFGARREAVRRARAPLS
ncbi:hypothetical protein [Microbacterium sp. 18062]|uniref:hypothetical protein n=1 Tax=Microbacterium sp. 18062 TaxID=2681410 RepID=UPI00135ADA28|nr:hypothetical protein [Microbacterium sp. 18062]